MSDPPVSPERERLSDAELRRILARAIELDQHLPHGATDATQNELHEIARTLGISGVAICTALREPCVYQKLWAKQPRNLTGRLRALAERYAPEATGDLAVKITGR